jgi:hypothetical protein
MRGRFRASIALALLWLAGSVRAQDASAPATGAPSGASSGDTAGPSGGGAELGDGAPAANVTGGDEGVSAAGVAPTVGAAGAGAAGVAPTAGAAGAGAAGAAPTGARAAPAIPPPAPIMVVALPSGRVPPDVVDAARAAVIAQVEPMAGGRPVRPLLAADIQAAIAACREPACVGAQIAAAGAIGAVLVHVARRTPRGPIELRIALVDPVSGSPRLPPILTTVPDPGAIAQALQPFLEQLRSAMFSPPPPPPQLRITVNVDGATVRVDDEVIGESPVVPIRLAPGRHVVTVQRDGYLLARREVELDMGENERVDITLQSFAAAGIEPPRDAGAGGSGDERGPEWYEHWGFWAGVGGAVVLGVVIGVAVGVAANNQGRPPDPQGIRLPPIR